MDIIFFLNIIRVDLKQTQNMRGVFSLNCFYTSSSLSLFSRDEETPWLLPEEGSLVCSRSSATGLVGLVVIGGSMVRVALGADGVDCCCRDGNRPSFRPLLRPVCNCAVARSGGSEREKRAELR